MMSDLDDLLLCPNGGDPFPLLLDNDPLPPSHGVDAGDEVEEPPELKYVPPEDLLSDASCNPLLSQDTLQLQEIKTEVLEEIPTGDETEQQYLGKGEEGKKGKRGRKPGPRRKRKLEDEEAEGNEDDDDWAPKKKRGPGRPRKQKAVEGDNTPMVPAVERERRQRKKYVRYGMSSGDEAEIKEEAPESPPPPQPKKRGRPSKKTAEQLKAERQRKCDQRFRQKMVNAELALESADNSSQFSTTSGASSEKPPPRRARRISEMTPEQAARERERWRRRKEREREIRALIRAELAEESKGAPTDPQLFHQKLKMLGVSCGYKKKRISEMTPEQQEKMRQKWHEQHLRRMAKRAEKGPEEVETERAKIRDRARLRRALAREGMVPPEAVKALETERVKDRERKRAKRAAMTPEERKEESRRNVQYRQQKLQKMSEDEKKAVKERQYFQRQARLAMMTTEEREEEKRKRREREEKKGYPARQRYQKLKETLGREGLRERQRRYWRDMSPTKKARELEKMRECYRKRIEKVKEDPGKWAEVQEKWKERQKRSKERQKEGVSRSRAKGGGNKEKESMTPEKRQQMRRLKNRRWKLKKKLEYWQKLLDSGMSVQQIQQETDSPQQRERRCIKQRIRKAKQQLRNRLQEKGAPEEEIEKKVEEIPETYTPTHAIRPYKPRPERRKLPEPEAIEKIKRELEALEEMERQVKGAKAPSPKKIVIRAPTPPPPVQQPPSQLPVQATPTVYSISSTTTTPPATLPITPIFYTAQGVQYAATTYEQYQGHTLISYTPQPSAPPPTAQTYAFAQILDAIAYQAQPYQQQQAPTAVFTATSSTAHADNIYFAAAEEVAATPSRSPAIDAYSEPSYSFQTEAPPKAELIIVAPTAAPTPTVAPVAPPAAAAPPPLPPAPAPTLPPPPPPVSRPKKKTPRKYVYRPPKNPNAKTRTKRKDVLRDVVCDVCGVAYNSLSLRAHKNQMHHPSYDVVNRKCLICGESYRHGQKWYTHYRRAHVLPETPKKAPEKGVVCEECGMVLSNSANLQKHKYYQHGDGTNPDNYITCPLCPEERRYKEKIGYFSHLRRFHPTYQRPGHDCFRCSDSFPNDKALCEHVQAQHKDSYFPCEYCGVCKFTRMGLHFHYGRCRVLSGQKGERQRLEAAWPDPIFTLERWQVNCELCDKRVIVSSLTRHYREMHNVREDRFTCAICKKTFKCRPFWVNHLEEKHLQTREQMQEYIHKVNAVNREGMTVKPRKGGSGRKTGWKACEERKPKRKATPTTEEEESSEEEVEEVPQPKKQRRKRRNVKVVCEEQEEEDERVEETVVMVPEGVDVVEVIPLADFLKQEPPEEIVGEEREKTL